MRIRFPSFKKKRVITAVNNLTPEQLQVLRYHIEIWKCLEDGCGLEYAFERVSNHMLSFTDMEDLCQHGTMQLVETLPVPRET